MSQMTLYVPDDVAERVRREAKRAGKSLSAYVTEILSGGKPPARWPNGFSRLYGSCDLPAPASDDADAPPDEPESL